MLTPMLTTAYRTLLPERLRAPLWHLRSAGQAWLTRGRPLYRQRLLDYYKSVGIYRRVVQTAVGTRLAVDLRDEGVGSPIFTDQEYEPAETQFIARTLAPGEVFVDIGANLGYFATLASRCVGPRGRVIAFEPDPDTCELLRGNLRRNGADNATVCSYALGAESRSGELFRSESNYGDHRVAAGSEKRKSVPISIRRFDEVCGELRLDRVDFIKIDVQGYEPHVFAGMGDCLTRLGVRTILMELWPHGIRYAGGSPMELLDRLLAQGFVTHELDEQGATRGVEASEMLARVESMNAEQPSSFVNLVMKASRR